MIRRTSFIQTSSIAYRNDAPMNSPGCVDEIRRLEEFLQKRFPKQRACLRTTSDFAQAYESAGAV
jgi:hypothetical protein